MIARGYNLKYDTTQYRKFNFTIWNIGIFLLLVAACLTLAIFSSLNIIFAPMAPVELFEIFSAK
jgi:energy-coupling factor transporter transmembrane protein EcfT